MTTEQKAKAYDEALERAKEMCTTLSDKAISEYIFPELKESEDEKIRKSIIHLVNAIYKGNEFTLPEFGKDLMLKWLEKQSKEKYIDNLTPQEAMDIAVGKCFEQGEQKPIDKVEPKFKNGQWLIWQNKCYKVNDNGCGYELVDQNGLSTSLEYGTIDENAHLWTIQDAKEGDVLALNGEVFIYAHRKRLYSIAVTHCFVDSVSDFYVDGEFGYTEKGNSIHPANKEQRELLFQKMREAGYKWNDEKKELKKIEHKIAESESESIRKSLLKHFGKSGTQFWFDRNIKYRDVIAWLEKQGEKPKWTEEDESKVKEIVYFLDTTKVHYASTTALDDCIEWLKSLKERLGG